MNREYVIPRGVKAAYNACIACPRGRGDPPPVSFNEGDSVMIRRLIWKLGLLSALGVAAAATPDDPPDPPTPCNWFDYSYCLFQPTCQGDWFEWCEGYEPECHTEPYCFENACGDQDFYAAIYCNYY